MSTVEEQSQELSKRLEKTQEKLQDLSNKFQTLENEYHLDKKWITRIVIIFSTFLLAFFGVNYYQIPRIVEAELQKAIGKETLRIIQEKRDQIEQHAIQIEQYTTQIEQHATSAEKDANEINNIKKNLMQESEALRFTNCGEVYSCTPRACLAKCMELGMRMATYTEVYAWASAGRDHCAHMWMLDSKQSENPIRGFPMYHNQTTANTCGRTNTGDIPRMEGVNSNFSWDSEEKFDCACSSLK